MIFFTVSFSRFAPSRIIIPQNIIKKRFVIILSPMVICSPALRFPHRPVSTSSSPPLTRRRQNGQDDPGFGLRCPRGTSGPDTCSLCAFLRSLGITPISGRTSSEWKAHSRSAGSVPEQLSEFRNWFLECKMPLSEWHLATWAIRKQQFSEQLQVPFLELMGTHVKDLHFPLRSRNIFSIIGVVPVRQNRPKNDSKSTPGGRGGRWRQRWVRRGRLWLKTTPLFQLH